MKKRTRIAYFILAVILLAVALVQVVRYWQAKPEVTPEGLGAPATSASPDLTAPDAQAVAPLAARAKEVKPGEPLPAEAQAEVERCLGHTVKDMANLRAQFEAAGGEVSRNDLEWKVVHFEDEAGKPFRIRLARDPSQSGRERLTIQLFSVDEEGLPDPVAIATQDKQNPTMETLAKFTKEKKVTKDIEARSVLFANGLKLATEIEDGTPKKLELTGQGFQLACDAVIAAPACHCIR